MAEAFYYDGLHARRHAVRLSIDSGRLHIVGNGINASFALAQVDFGELLGRGPRFVELPAGARCEVADHAALDALLASVQHRDGLVVRLQARWRWAAASLLIVITAAVSGYLWGLPAAARSLAPHVPAGLTRQLTDSVLTQLDKQLLQASELPAERQQALRRQAETALRAHGLPAWRLHFRASKQLGPNAFALPAGDIVLLDKLVDLLDEQELIAVLAHEIGHVAHHHSMQQFIQGMAVSLLLAAWFGDVSSAAVVLSGQLLQAAYSRDAEREADAFAASLLDRCCGGRTALVSALDKLERQDKAGGDSWFGSHPGAAVRREAIQQLPSGK